MNTNYLCGLIYLARAKYEIDQRGSCSNGSETYIRALKNQIEGIIEELPKNRVSHLEDELGDLIWDYLNMLVCLESEKNICLESLFRRACQKYDERVSGVQSGHKWDEIKQKQKEKLALEEVSVST